MIRQSSPRGYKAQMSSSAPSIVPPTKSVAPNMGPKNPPFRKIVRDFFDHAEMRRRWNVNDSIPWADVKERAVDEELVSILEAFYATEMYLPDYTSELLELNRNDHGLSWFLTNWSYEESKHSMAIEQWFLLSGARTEEQMDEFNGKLLANRWVKPFETSRRMLVYTVFQELATQVNYLNLAKLTGEAKDPALQKVLLFIASDEGNHHRLFVDCVLEHLKQDHTGTLADIAHVLSNFSMPAHDQIPGWEARGKAIERSGIYSGKQFVKRVMLPGLKRLGVNRRDLPRA